AEVAAAATAYGDAVLSYTRADPRFSALADDLVATMIDARLIMLELAPLTEKLTKTMARLRERPSPDPGAVRSAQADSEYGQTLGEQLALELQDSEWLFATLREIVEREDLLDRHEIVRSWYGTGRFSVSLMGFEAEPSGIKETMNMSEL